MRQYVHRPHLLPRRIRLRERVVEIELLRGNARVRNQEVDATVMILDCGNHGCHCFCAAHIAGKRQPTRLARGIERRVMIEIGDRDAGRTASGELPAERPADAARRARDERHSTGKLHAPCPGGRGIDSVRNPAGDSLEAASAWRPSSNFAIWLRCTSSGPSASRSVRALAYA